MMQAPGVDWVLKPAVAKILKRPFCPFLSSFFFVSNRPWAAQNQVAHVAIAKMPQQPVRLWLQLLQQELQRNVEAAEQGFFPGGTRGVPPSGENFANPPPIRYLSPFLDQGLSPPSQGSSPKIWKI